MFGGKAKRRFDLLLRSLSIGKVQSFGKLFSHLLQMAVMLANFSIFFGHHKGQVKN